MMEGDVAEKDNVLLTLCCSKNSYNQENGEGEGGFIYRVISVQLSSRLRADVRRPSLPGSETQGRRMRFRMSMKISLPDKKDSEWGKKRTKTGRDLWQPHWSVLAFFGPIALLQEHTRAESGLVQLVSKRREIPTCTYASGEVPGLLGAGFAEAASLPDSTEQTECLRSTVNELLYIWSVAYVGIIKVTLEPSNLGGRAIALLIAGGNTEDDGRLGGVVDVCVGEAGRLHQARRVGSTIYPHEG